MTSPLNDPRLEHLLDRLHQMSDAQIAETDAAFEKREQEIPIDEGDFYDAELRGFLADKLVALDRDKGLFCYLLCRSLKAKRIVEAGTSYGVSTLYLAAAVRDNQNADGLVIGTEIEPAKVKIARENFRKAGLNEYIDLREGDLRQTLQDLREPIDFVLIDIWEVAQYALELVSPHLRPGAIVACDNTAVDIAEYGEYFEYLNDPRNRFKTMTVPFEGGFEISVRI
ncbi:MAG: methyltransferase [Chloroflexota bacterium]|nr:MAG: methyltransferase [Chloroflexota bacterium]